MSVTERDRQRMFQAFEQTWGQEVAMIFAEHLPPAGWGDLATRPDIGNLRSDLEALREATIADFAAVRRDMESVRSDLQRDIESLRSDLQRDIEIVRSDVATLREATRNEFAAAREHTAISIAASEYRVLSRVDQRVGELALAMSQQTKAMLYAFIGAVTTFGSLVFVATTVAGS